MSARPSSIPNPIRVSSRSIPGTGCSGDRGSFLEISSTKWVRRARTCLTLFGAAAGDLKQFLARARVMGPTENEPFSIKTDPETQISGSFAGAA